MSSHPNLILMVILTPDDLSRKTMRNILQEYNVDYDDEIKIGNEEYYPLIMEKDYDESWQISAKEGDLIFLRLLTYGYGESISFKELDNERVVLEEWALKICKKYNCTYEIRVTANYW